MSLPFVSVSGATAPGTGAVRDLETSVRVHTLVISATGAPSGFVVELDGSHDGANWVVLANANEGSPVRTAAEHLVRFVRARVVSITGGTSPTVSATIASQVSE